MKSSKLIELLKEADPSGNTEVCVSNCDIKDVDRLPAYYDGRLETLKYDAEGYVCGGKYHSSGDKIMINYQSITDAVENAVEFDNQQLDVDYSELGASTTERYKEYNAKRRENMLEMVESLELKMFKEWIWNKIKDEYPETEGLERMAEEFFRENLSRFSDEIPQSELPATGPDGKPFWNSYHERRKVQWNKEIEVDWINRTIKRVSGKAVKPEVQKFEHYKGWDYKRGSVPVVITTFWQNLKKKLTNFFN